MSSKKIYLVRHGQTDFNRLGFVQGSGVDSSLNDFGRLQALAFFNAYQHVAFDKIYTSALKRSIESVWPFIDKGIPFESFSGLNEINWGNKEGQPITPQEDEYYHYMLDQWRKGNTKLRIERGESPEDVTNRLIPVVDHIKRQEAEKNILVCMHGRAMRILLCYLLGESLDKMDHFEHVNMGLYLLRYSDGIFSIELFNDTSHLSSLS